MTSMLSRYLSPWTLLLLTLMPAAAVAGADPAELSPSEKRAQRRTPVVEVFQARRDAVVNISTTRVVRMRSMGMDPLFERFFDLPAPGPVREYKRTSVGSGFVIHRDGYIITNAHVVARTAERKVIFDDEREYDARVIAMDTERDLAVLKIDADRTLEPVPMGRGDDLMIGETTVAIGNPLGYEHTVTVGVVSATNRTLHADERAKFEGLIQTDASINPGNSGGPLFNIVGELIGINTAIRADAQNIGFAIPVDQLRELLPDLLDVERRYRIVTGLKVGDGPAEDKTADGGEATGCVVREVAADSPAAAAGLQPGDRITAIDGEPIRTALDLHFALVGRAPGQTLALTVAGDGEDGEPTRTTLTLAERPQPDGDKLLWKKFGLAAKPLDKQAARRLRFDRPLGLVITDVGQGSEAQRIGLREGDIVIQIGRHQPSDMDDVGEMLEQVDAGDAVTFAILRIDGRRLVRFNIRLRAQ